MPAAEYFSESNFNDGSQALLIGYRAEKRIGLHLCHPHGHVLIVKLSGSRSGFNSAVRIGEETGAPGLGRTVNGAAIVLP